MTTSWTPGGRAPTLHRDEVDGVPVFWVDSGRTMLTAELVFRTGIVDETLPTSGWTHLVEHLALHESDGGALEVDGSTSLLHTRFAAAGTPAEVAAFLAHVTRWLADPGVARLAGELGVLRAEAQHRGVGVSATALLQRFGARGPGVAAFAEPGLARLTPERLRELTSRRFTAGNAALVLDGPVPPGLALHLPPGVRHDVPRPPAVPERLRAAYQGGAEVVLSGEVERGPAGRFVPWCVQEALRRELREAAGGAYSPWSGYERVGPSRAVVVAGSDVSDALRPEVVERSLAVVASLRARGPVEAEVAVAVERALRRLTDPSAVSQFAARAAALHLEGRPVEEPEEVLARTAAVDAVDVHRELLRFSGSFLLGVPFGATWREELPLLTAEPRTDAGQGVRYSSRNRPVDRSVLVVGPAGVRVGEGSAWHAVDTEDLVGVLASDDGARHLVTAAGYGLVLEPSLWRLGEDAVARVDALVPEDLVIPVVARPAGAVPSPLSARVRWASELQWRGRVALVWLRLLWAPLLFLGLAAFFLLATVVIGHAGVGLAALCTVIAGRVAAATARERSARGGS